MTCFRYIYTKFRAYTVTQDSIDNWKYVRSDGESYNETTKANLAIYAFTSAWCHVWNTYQQEKETTEEGYQGENSVRQHMSGRGGQMSSGN